MVKKLLTIAVEKTSEKEPHIALLLMCKNETKRMLVTLMSVVGHVDSLVVYDTGSTDDTLDIIRTFSEKYSIPLRLKEGVFENFSTSRNVSLDFADTFDDIDYILLMDVNDELQGGKDLRKFARENMNKDLSAFLVCQEWKSSHNTKYYNMRFVKARKGWRYMGRVHEWMKNMNEDGENAKVNDSRVTETVVLYQDRTQDDDKTGKRFYRDKILLLEDHLEDPTEPRTVFYLAQTCMCLGQTDEAYYYYKLRTTLIGFFEERYESCYKCGDLSQELKHDWSESMGWYLKAFELINRAEPIVRIVQHYRSVNQWELSYIFADMACRLSYPVHCVLFVNKHIYDYERWHLLGIVGWYSGHHVEGKTACIQALKVMPDSKIDRDNLGFYENKEREQERNSGEKNIREEFISKKIQEMSRQNPRQTYTQLQTKAKLLWQLEIRKNG